jgi:hypothetical protein
VLADHLEDLPSSDELAALGAADLAAVFHRLDFDRRIAEARLVALVEVVEHSGVHELDGHTTTAGWLRAIGKWSGAEARHRVRTARMAGDIGIVAEALAAGTLGVAQSHELARAHANPRCGDQLGEVADTLLDAADHLSFDEFRCVVQRWETLADTDGAHRDAAASHDRRHASLAVDADGMNLLATGSALSGAVMGEVLRRFCDAEFAADWDATSAVWGDQTTPSMLPRTDGQRRFDALEEIFRRAASSLPGRRQPEPLVNIVVDLDTLTDVIADAAAPSGSRSTRSSRPSGDPTSRRCETADGTPLTPAEILVAALAGHVRRVVVDSAGVVVDLGRRRRLFTGPVRDAVLLSNQRCIWPGCPIPASRCQADHVTAWSQHGTTDTANGAPLCARHNRLKSTGFTTWRDGDGRWHTRRPDGSLIT